MFFKLPPPPAAAAAGSRRRRLPPLARRLRGMPLAATAATAGLPPRAAAASRRGSPGSCRRLPPPPPAAAATGCRRGRLPPLRPLAAAAAARCRCRLPRPGSVVGAGWRLLRTGVGAVADCRHRPRRRQPQLVGRGLGLPPRKFCRLLLLSSRHRAVVGVVRAGTRELVWCRGWVVFGACRQCPSRLHTDP